MIFDPFERIALTTQAFQDSFSRAILSVGPVKQMEIDGLRASGRMSASQMAVLERMGGIISTMLSHHGMGPGGAIGMQQNPESARSSMINFMLNVYGSPAWSNTFDEIHALYLSGEIDRIVESAVSSYYDIILSKTTGTGPVAQAIGMAMPEEKQE